MAIKEPSADVDALYEQMSLIGDSPDSDKDGMSCSKQLMPLFFDGMKSYVRIIEEGLAVNNHLDLLKWLQGEIQLYLPHEIMLALWFQLDGTHLRHDLISALPGVRTEYVLPDAFLKLQRMIYDLWAGLGKVPFSIKLEESGAADHFSFGCALGKTMSGMRSVLVHGISDIRTSQECLYIAFSSNANLDTSSLAAMVTLLPHLDIALRRIEAFVPDQRTESVTVPSKRGNFGLSAREAEILQLVKTGKTNGEIANILSISPSTVKNHLRHLFQKLEVNNRTHAIAKWERGFKQ